MRRIMLGLVLTLIAASPANAHTLWGKDRARIAKLCEQSYTVKEYKRYASRVYKRERVSAKAHRRMRMMHVCLRTYNQRKAVGRLHTKFIKAREYRQMLAARPVITPLMSCIIHHESRGNPLAQNGQYKGIAQWSPEAWARHGGLKYGPTPHHATYWEQVQALADGLRRFGCRDWCPFDPC